MNLPLNNPYYQPAEHSFKLYVAPTSHEKEFLPTDLILSNQQGMPIPWHLAEESLELLLQTYAPHSLAGHTTLELLITVHPETGEQEELKLHLSFRPDPTGPTTNPQGVRTHRGTLAARGADQDPDSEPLTRIWTVIDVDTGAVPTYSTLYTSPSLRSWEADQKADRVARQYGLSPVPERTRPQLELALADFAWDTENDVFAPDYESDLRIRLINCRNAARWDLRDRAEGHVPEPEPTPATP